MKKSKRKDKDEDELETAIDGTENLLSLMIGDICSNRANQEKQIICN
jgi:hypothetical protein